MEKLYGLYDIKKNEQCVGIFTSVKSIAQYTGNTVGSVYSAISRNNKIKARYKVVKIHTTVRLAN